ncbi:hypothetical protein M433DRAFT_158974 [Acidomyces richmondensis BFW]|nr:MAG: hypothetical protein FE78DRAFT_86476 [Acidomyces sp. 'richmondensis']KYG41490.1 hypothetical protein M433DRAFT_158974 [Acidomyces richmondensis BFW]
MAIQIFPAEDADMSRIFEICSLAFARNEIFFDVMYPEHWTDKGRQIGGKRMLKTKHEDAHTVFLKAVDSETGTIMGMAKWNIYNNSLPDLSEIESAGDYWENEDDHAYATAILNIFLQQRNAAIKASNGNLLSLDILAIDPKFQRQGVGGALVKWGTDKADSLGVETVVESSVYGKGLYLKNGFVFIKDVVLRNPERWNKRASTQYAWLIRPRSQHSA